MLSVVPYEPRHLIDIQARKEQAIELGLGGQSISDMAAFYAEAGDAYSILQTDDAGEAVPIFCGGVIQQGEHSASLWGVFSVVAPKVGVYVIHRIRHFIDKRQELRLDAWVNYKNARARKLILTLGFELEGSLNDFFAPGVPAVIYRRAG